MTVLVIALYYIIGLVLIGYGVRKLCLLAGQTHYTEHDIFAWLVGAAFWPIIIVVYLTMIGIRVKIR